MKRKKMPIAFINGIMFGLLAGFGWYFLINRYDTHTMIAVGPVPPNTIQENNVPIESLPLPQTDTPDPNELPAKNVTQEEHLVPYNGPIEHIFFHPLIAYPELAFDNDYMSKGYNDWFVTVKEFDKILDSLYKKNFILIDIHSIYDEKIVNGKHTFVKKDLLLPENKNPLIISIDDLNYYKYMIQNGNNHKLILDSNGNIATLSVTPEGETVTLYDNEIVPILDGFVKQHPDFSFHGAKGTIALTGYEGILGYRTNNLNSPNYESEKRDVLQVIQRMKNTGWSFSSHGYGHLDANTVSYQSFVQDTQQWKKEVEPLVGPTSVYIYPFGSRVPTGSAKYQYLLQSGFHVLCSVGPTPHLQITPDSVMMDRRHIDGIALHSQKSLLLNLFDTNEVIDDVRPPQKH